MANSSIVLTYTFQGDEFHHLVGQLALLYPAQRQKSSFQTPTPEQKESWMEYVEELSPVPQHYFRKHPNV